MSTISFSQNLRKVLGDNLFTIDGEGSGAHTATFKSYYLYAQSQFRIMKGTVPANFSSLTKAADRSADILVEWAGDQFNWVTDVVPTANTQYTNASQSGTAAWFWWLQREYDDNDPAVDNLIWQIVGTVGTSGTDLVLDNTEIVAGSPYRIYNFAFSIPETFTY